MLDLSPLESGGLLPLPALLELPDGSLLPLLFGSAKSLRNKWHGTRHSRSFLIPRVLPTRTAASQLAAIKAGASLASSRTPELTESSPPASSESRGGTRAWDR